MSYSRWAGSCWYCFPCGDDSLALWYSIDGCLDWTYSDLTELMMHPDSEVVAILVEKYGCTDQEGVEAVGYIRQFLIDSQPTHL